MGAKMTTQSKIRPPSRAIGTKTTVVFSSIPSSASAGSIVAISIRVGNKTSSSMKVMGGIVYSYGGNNYDAQLTTSDNGIVNAGSYLTISGRFTMPSGNVVVHAYSYYYDETYGSWYYDTEETQTVVGQTVYNPSLSCSSSVQSGSSLSFSVSGFPGYDSVWVGVVGGGGKYITTNSSGSGSGSFVINESAGTYTLEADDDTYRVTRSFTVTAAPAYWSQIATVNTSISLEEVGYWSQIATSNINVGIEEIAYWSQIATVNTSISLEEVGYWSEVYTLSVSVELEEIGYWSELDISTIQMQVGEPEPDLPENYELVKHYKSKLNDTYSGPVEMCVTNPFTINLPEQLGAWWLADKTVQAFEDNFKKNGMDILELKLYADTAPTLYTNFIIEATYVLPQPPPESVALIQIGIPVLIAIISICLAAIAISIAGAISIKSITDSIRKNPVATTITTLLIVAGVVAVTGAGLYIYSKNKK
jgi:uncharacterized membrane protein